MASLRRVGDWQLSFAGTNSYVLFTLDKLICRFVKQFQALLADDLAQVMDTLYVHRALWLNVHSLAMRDSTWCGNMTPGLRHCNSLMAKASRLRNLQRNQN